MKSPETYCFLMGKSMTFDADGKFFFANKIDWCRYDVIVDFGCANLEMLSIIDDRLVRPSTKLIGIDKAEFEPYKPLDEFLHEVKVYPDLKCIPFEEIEEKKILIIFSSVLHELGADYKGVLKISEWCQKYAETVVCRDMYFIPEYKTIMSAKSCGLSELKEWELFHKICELSRPDPSYTSTLLTWYEKLDAIHQLYLNQTGSQLSVTALLYEFFLKYTYDLNWETEIEEMYFCNNALLLLEDLFFYFSRTYYRTFTLRYKKKQIKKQFKYKMKLPTHIQFILERREIYGGKSK